MQSLPDAGKYIVATTRGNSMQSQPSAGKPVVAAKRGKTCSRCQARENIQSLPCAKKIHVTVEKRGKTKHG